MPLQLRLGERRRELELALQPDACGDVPEELLDGLDADRRQHRLPVGVGQREIAHASSNLR